MGGRDASPSWDAIIDAVAVRAGDPTLLTDTSAIIPAKRGPPLDLGQVPAIEAIIGFPLPHALLDLYVRVGNGGFGPAYGLMALHPTDRPSFGGNAVAVLLLLRGDGFEVDDPPPRPWPVGLLPLVHRGCSLYTCIDCLDPSLPVLTFDADGPDADADRPVHEVITQEGLGFANWLLKWAMHDGDPRW